MNKKILKIVVFVFILALSLSLTSSLFARDLETDYEFTARDRTILTQPSICYVTTMYYAYVYDPNFEAWSQEYFFGPMGGTGFSVNPETGHIVTAAHVIEVDYVDIKWSILDAYIWDTYPDDYWNLTDADWNWIYDNFEVEGRNRPEPDREVWVQFNTATGGVPDNPDSTYMRAEVIDSSPWEQRDIAVLKIQPTTGRALSAAIIGDSSGVEIQDSLTVSGYPWTADISWESIMTPTVTSGIISAKKMLAGTEVLQVDATAEGGSSGSPVLSEQGEVIGMLTMGMTENINYLRPSNDIMEMLNRNGVVNTLGMVDDSFANGLAMYRQSHFSEAIQFFDAVLNLSQGHLLAQEYKANAQAAVGRGEDIPLEPRDADIAIEEPEQEAPFFEEPEQIVEEMEPIQEPEPIDAQEGEFPWVWVAIIGAVVFFLIIVIIIVVVIIVVVKKKNAKAQTSEPAPPPSATEPKAPPKAEPEKEAKKQPEGGKRFCTSCGNEVQQGEQFCSNCGNKIE